MKLKLEKPAYRNSILYKIMLLIYVLCFIIIFYSGTALSNGWRNYKQAMDLITLEDIMESFSYALKSFMFERGRTNVILSAASPISKYNLDFILERRTVADLSFEKGFTLMEESYKKEADLLRFDYGHIQDLRQKMDVQMSKHRSQRDPDSRNVWFSACTNYINSVSNTLKRINEPHFNSLIGRYIELIINTLRFRSITGNESSLFTAAISDSGMLSDEEYSTLLSLRGESKQLWFDIRNSIDMLDSKELSNATQTVQETYYKEFRFNQDRLLDLAKNDRLYEGAQKEIANLSVPALNSILLLADQALEEIHRENQNSMQIGYRHFLRGLLALI
ncbi:MAG TPA: hypothetical protein DDZ89_18305, partial [Clostridiales bacterium]|nr:hypothetical protein [Clostridiales bacterium]